MEWKEKELITSDNRTLSCSQSATVCATCLIKRRGYGYLRVQWISLRPLEKKEPAKNYYPEINTDHKRHTFIVAMQPHQYTIPLSRWTLLIYMKRVAWSSTLRYGNGTSSRLEKQGLQGLISQFTVTSLVPWHEFQTCAIRKVKTFLNRWVQFLKNNRIQLRQAPSFVVADL